MLYLFDLDGTVIRSFLREGAPRTPENYAEVELLPGRREKLSGLREAGHSVAFVTNQGGVAMGYQRREEVVAKLAAVFRALGCLSVVGADMVRSSPGDGPPAVFYVAYGHAKATVVEWRTGEGDGWRKPGGWMISQALLDYNVPASHVLFVGDMDSDREAAEAAGVRYSDAVEFFA